MKRWFVVLLVVLALVVLISPGIIGKLAEQNMEESIKWAEKESPGVLVETESFDRGWFSSVGRHRVTLRGSQFAEAASRYTAATGNPELPTFIIDTRMDHGLLPISSLGRDEGSLSPGLASTISTFMFDTGSGEPTELPGTLYSNVSLGGATDSKLLIEKGEFSNDAATASWEGADLALYHDRSTGEMSVKGSIEPWSVSGKDGGVNFGKIDIDGAQVRTEYGFSTGPIEVEFGPVTINPGPGQVDIGGAGISMDLSVDGGLVSTTSAVSVDAIMALGFGEVTIAIDSSATGLDAVALGAITVALRDAQASADAADWEALFPLIEGDLQALLSSGLEVRIDRLDFSLPQGDVTTRIVVDIAEKDADEAFSWPGVILAATASVDFRLPVALFDLAAMMNPQAGALLAMGILEKDGDDYVMEARYAAGLITVNGAPMPIPIPGL